MKRTSDPSQKTASVTLTVEEIEKLWEMTAEAHDLCLDKRCEDAREHLHGVLDWLTQLKNDAK